MTLVPRLLGKTQQAVATKAGGARASRQWSEETFDEVLRQQQGDDALLGAHLILNWARGNGLEVLWGKGMQDGSFTPRLVGRDVPHWFVTCYTYGRMEVLFQYMTSGPFADESKREELRQRLNIVRGFDISREALARRPRLPLAALKDEPTRTALLAALDWALAEARAWEAASQ